MANSKTRPTTRMLAMLLALFTFLGVIPLSPFVLLKVSAADPGSAKPTSEMLDNFVLRALEYTGYDVQAQKDNDTLYVQGYYAGKTPSKILSGIGYGTGNGGGVATVPDSRTKTGRAPDIAKFKSGGLECGSFVSYVFLNYLPNIEGVEMQGIKEQLPNGTNSDDTWYSTLKTLTSQGKAKQITIGTPDFSLVGTLDTGDKNAEIDYVDWSKLEIGDIIVFGTESSTAHVAIYAGTCHNGWRNTHFIIHVGNERGPEISEARYMADSGSKSSVPIAVYRLIPVEPTPPPEPEVGTIEVNKHDDSGTALSGAVFTATNTSTRETVTIGPTDSRGYAKKDNVPYGTYEVVETTFPSGYTSSGTSKWTVTVGKSMPTVTVNAVNTAVDGYGKIVKVSEDGKVFGIRFHIEGNGVDMDVTTGSDGTVTQGLRPGTYTVTELASDEYVPQAAQTLTVVADRTATVTFSNTLKRGTLKVTKTAYDGFVEDITFHLYGTSDSGQEVNMYATTDSSGVATFNDVLVGSNYVLEEVDTPERYVVPDIEYVDIEYNVVARADVYNDEKVGSAKVIKTSDDDNVRGIRFHLYGTANSGERVDLYATTDRDGIADFGEVPSGTGYTVEEVDVPDWYEEPREQEIDVIEGRTTEVRFHNTLKVGDLTVTKTSEDDNVSGRRFHLYGTSDAHIPVDEYAVTDEFGTAYFRDIPIGMDYVLEEVGTPDWYIVPSPQTVDIKYDDSVECSFNNVLKRGDLRVTKTSFDGLVTGITFRLTGISDSGESVNETAVTNDAGVAEFHDILVGSNYRLEEEGAADYYVIPDIENVEVTWGDVTAQSVHNAPKVGTLKVMKTADDGKVSGRRFHLYGKADSGTVIDLYADTDGNGVATFSDVEIGKGYTIEEVGTPEWYIIPEPQAVDIEYGITVEASFNNALKRGDLVVHKTSEDDKVEGRTFRLHGTSLSGEIVDMTASTDAAGTAYFRDIPIGNGYILEETDTPEWYIVPASVTVDITENATVERSFENILKRGSLKVTKTSFDGLVEGLQFRLTGTSLSGIPVDVTVATDSNGIAIFENILIGSNYRLEEVGTPNYYIIPDMQNVNITWNDVTVTTFYNDAKRGNLTVHKTSEDDEVEGRRFHLYGTSDAHIPVDEYAVTDEFGTAYFRDILIGQYTLEEVDTPEKYIVPAPQTVTIGRDETVEASFCNELKRSTLEIVKNSEDGLQRASGSIYTEHLSRATISTFTL